MIILYVHNVSILQIFEYIPKLFHYLYEIYVLHIYLFEFQIREYNHNNYHLYDLFYLLLKLFFFNIFVILSAKTQPLNPQPTIK